jgi:hypothetical protein
VTKDAEVNESKSVARVLLDTLRRATLPVATSFPQVLAAENSFPTKMRDSQARLNCAGHGLLRIAPDYSKD